MFYVLKKENSQTINNIIDTKNCVCFYHWVNCGHCHQMMPTWMKLCKDHGKDVNIINIEMSNMQYLNPTSRNVMGFPTIMSYKNGSKKEEFNGMRDYDSLEKFLMKYKLTSTPKPVAKPSAKPTIKKATKAKKPVKPKK
jgi:hypothetical protein